MAIEVGPTRTVNFDILGVDCLVSNNCGTYLSLVILGSNVENAICINLFRLTNKMYVLGGSVVGRYGN